MPPRLGKLAFAVFPHPSPRGTHDECLRKLRHPCQQGQSPIHSRQRRDLEIERETDLTGYDLVLNIDLRGKDMDSTGDWMSAIRELVYSWDPVEEALIAAGCPGAPSVDRIIEDFKSTYESSICGIEAICQIVTNAWDEKTATEGTHSESLDQMCERASSAIDGAMDDSRAVERSENIDK